MDCKEHGEEFNVVFLYIPPTQSRLHHFVQFKMFNSNKYSQSFIGSLRQFNIYLISVFTIWRFYSWIGKREPQFNVTLISRSFNQLHYEYCIHFQTDFLFNKIYFNYSIINYNDRNQIIRLFSYFCTFCPHKSNQLT